MNPAEEQCLNVVCKTTNLPSEETCSQDVEVNFNLANTLLYLFNLGLGVCFFFKNMLFEVHEEVHAVKVDTQIQ